MTITSFDRSDYNNKENLSNILKYYWEKDNVVEPGIYPINELGHGKRRDLKKKDKIEIYEVSYPIEVSDIGHNREDAHPRYTLNIKTCESEDRIWLLYGEVRRIFALDAVKRHPTDQKFNATNEAMPFQYIKKVGRKDLSPQYSNGWMIAYDVVLEYVHRPVGC